jgi:putative uncharacterized protein (fragment)
MFCDFKTIRGKVLKTVDAVYENVKTTQECRQVCLSDKLPCYSFDMGDPTSQVCRTSHLESASLTHIKEAYFEVAGANTYELTSCYNSKLELPLNRLSDYKVTVSLYLVTVLCKSKEMTAKISTNRIFDGKIYAKNTPNSCLNDVMASLDFELPMFYNDPRCNVQRYNSSFFANDIILQHHDYIVTTKDLGLSLQCAYDFSNRIVANSLILESNG